MIQSGTEKHMVFRELIRGLMGGEASPFPQWPSIPRARGARASFESLLLALFTCLGHVMREEGTATRDLLKEMKKFGVSQLRLNSDDELLAINIFTKAHHGQGSFARSVERFRDYSEGSDVLRRRFLETLIYFVGLRTKPSDEIEEMLLFAAETLGVEDEVAAIRAHRESVKEKVEAAKATEDSVAQDSVKRLRMKVKEVTAKTLDRSYLILGCAQADSLDKIEAAYKKLVFEFHPDRARGRGESAERLQEVRAHYEAILRAFSNITSERRKSR